MAVRQQQRRGTAAQWTSANPILSAAEIGYETDTNKFKIGDGTNRWATLSYFVDLDTMIAGAPGLLNSLDELAAAIGDDPAFFTTVGTNLSNHQADTTNIHGIADTAALATKTYADAAEADAITAAGAAADSKVAAAVAALTKSSVGLANVDNTTDANKPVSNATQTELDLKAPLASPALTGNPTAPTQTVGNDSTRVATTAFVKAAIQNIASLDLVLDGGGV